MKVFGFIPARMAASRFPGKPLFPLLGRTMLDHVFSRSKCYENWSKLLVATCDKEIENFCLAKKFPVVMTKDTHIRAMDRICEAVEIFSEEISEEDIVVMVQGDEPMMRPDMIEAVVAPLKKDPRVGCSVLGMEIHDESIWMNPDTVKIIHDLKDRVLYTSRAPVPYAKKFSPDLGAFRIYGIFAFRKSFLKRFSELMPSPLEIKEACDSNRIFDNGLVQMMARYPNIQSFSVDSPHDAKLVEQGLQVDPWWGKY